MLPNHSVSKADGDDEDARAAAEAQRMVEASETGGRQLTGVLRRVVFWLAIAWSLFQLSIASWLTLDSVQSRAIHLAFAITMTFWSFPRAKPPVKKASGAITSMWGWLAFW